jgi:hypothetical protein
LSPQSFAKRTFIMVRLLPAVPRELSDTFKCNGEYDRAFSWRLSDKLQ